MDWKRSVILVLVGMLVGFGLTTPWERGCIAAAVGLLCVLVIVGPSKEG